MKVSKVLIVVIILIVILFAVGIGVGASQKDGGGGDDETPNWVETMGDLFITEEPLEAKDIRSDCFRSKMFVVETSCKGTVLKSEADRRKAKLVLTEGDAVKFVYTPKDSTELTVKATIKPDQDLSIGVGKEGGELSFKKQGKKTCKVKLEKAD